MHTRSTAPWRRRAAAARASTAGVVLGIDVDAHLGPPLEQVVETGDGLGAVHPGLGHLGPGQVADQAGAVGDPVQALVVEGAQDTVGGDVHVGLHVAVAERHRALEGGHGVLRPVAGAPAVGEGDGLGLVQEGEVGHGWRLR